jgi:hypothetical protein
MPALFPTIDVTAQAIDAPVNGTPEAPAFEAPTAWPTLDLGAEAEEPSPDSFEEIDLGARLAALDIVTDGPAEARPLSPSRADRGAGTTEPELEPVARAGASEPVAPPCLGRRARRRGRRARAVSPLRPHSRRRTSSEQPVWLSVAPIPMRHLPRRRRAPADAGLPRPRARTPVAEPA